LVEQAALLPHDGRVVVARFSHAGRHLATATTGGRLGLWDVATGDSLLSIKAHEQRINFVDFAPDDGSIVTASDDSRIGVFTPQGASWRKGGLVDSQYLTGHQRAVGVARFVPPGSRVVSASFDNTVRLWGLAGGTEIAVFQGHVDSVSSVEVSSDGHHILTGSVDGTARVWDLKQSPRVGVLRGHAGIIFEGSFDLAGSRVVTASQDNTARIWQVDSGAMLARLQGHSRWVRSARFSHRGDEVVTASDDGVVKVWRWLTEGGVSQQSLNAGNGRQVWAEFSRDDTRVVAVGRTEHSASLWSTESASEPIAWLRHGNHVNAARFSPDGSLIATASEDGTVRLWDARDGFSRAVLLGHTKNVDTVAFDAEGARLVSASEDGQALVWSVKEARRTATISHGSPVAWAHLSPSGQHVITGSMDGRAGLWLASDGSLLEWITDEPEEVIAGAFSHNGRWIVTTAGTMARLWRFDGRSVRKHLDLRDHTGAILAVHFSPDDKHILTVGADFEARLWPVLEDDDLRAALRTATLYCPGADNPVLSR
jgi:WD40 repeat protein